MSASNGIQQLNRDLAEKLNEEALHNPQSPNAGKFAGIANGKLVVVADNWDEVAQHLRQAEPDPAKCFCIELGRDYSEPEEIWDTLRPHSAGSDSKYTANDASQCSPT